MAGEEHEEITFTREQFYDKIWSEPTTKVASELGCSDVMVAKICKSYDIPKPYLGYWAKLQYGKKPKKTRLPKNDDPAIQSLTFYKRPGRETAIETPVLEPVYEPDIQGMLDEARSLEPVNVAGTLRSPHPLVAATRDQIKFYQTPYRQRPHRRPDFGPTLSISVSEKSLSRALCIMNALIRRVERIGGRVEIQKEKWHEHRTRTVIIFAGEEVTDIRIREKNNQVRVSPAMKKHSWERETELIPTGQLIIDKGPSYFDRVLLRDTPKRRRIEKGLNDLIIELIKKAGEKRIRDRRREASRKRDEAEAKIRQQRDEELRKKREDLATRQKAEQVRIDDLLRKAQSWRQAGVIREYLSAVQRFLMERDGAIAEGGEFDHYLKWGHEQADRFDPLKPNPPSVLDEQV